MARNPPSSSSCLLVLAVLLPLLGACSAPGEDGCERDGQAGFEPRAPFDARARLRRVDCAFRSGVSELVSAPDGSTWLRRIEYKDRGEDTFFHPPDKLLTHVGAGGELLSEQRLPDFVSALAAHPSGELTVVGWERSEDALSVPLRRLRPDGSLLAERVLSLPVPPEERMYFQAFPDGSVVRAEQPEEERRLTVILARAHGEDVFLLVSMDGYRLMRLDGALQVRWVTPVAPGVQLLAATWEQMRAMGVPFTGWALDVDAAGRAHVALPFIGAHRRAYAMSFAVPPEGPGGRTILVSRFEPTGERSAVRTVPTEHVDDISSLVASGETFALGARAATPVDQPGKRTEADLFFAAGRWDGPADALVLRTHSIDQDDAPAALLPCGEGRYCFAGHTSYLETDELRTREDGEGFLLVVDGQGEPGELLRLAGERDTEVRAAAAGPGGSVVFALSTNQPANVALVGDDFKDNEMWLGVFSPR